MGAATMASSSSITVEPFTDRPVILVVPAGEERFSVAEAETFLLRFRLAITEAKQHRSRPVIHQGRLPYRD